MTRVVFQEVSIRQSKSGKCLCGVRRTRSTKLYQTLNPFNRNAAGLPKTCAEIAHELHEAAAAWQAAPIICPNCAPLTRPPPA